MLALFSELCRSGGINLRPTGTVADRPLSGRPASFSVVVKLVMKKTVREKGVNR